MPAILLLGLVLGMRHACEADHLAAIAALSTGQRRPLVIVLRGIAWGLGHTSALLGAGVVSLGLGFAMPREAYLDKGIGVMLAALGVAVLWRMGPRERHHHHGEARPRRGDDGPEPSRPRWRIDWKAAGVGTLHGLAGSAPLMLMVASTMTSRVMGLVYIGVFGLGSIVGMALLSMAIVLPVDRSARRFAGAYVAMEWMVALGTILIGIRMLR